MQLVPTGEVREGLTIARDVRDERGRILLARGQRLTGSAIQRLYKFRIQSVYLRDGYGEEEPELIQAEIKQKCQEILSQSFGKMAHIAAAKKLTLDAGAIQYATESLVEALLCNRDPLVSLLDINTGSDSLLQHSVSSALLAITLALDLDVSTDRLHHLASAMLFHDIGMIFLPETLLDKSSALTKEEITLLRNHTKIGATHLLQTQAVSSVAASIVLRHHEAMDGSGYPEGVQGDKLSVLSRIACVVEAYDSMTSPRPFAPAIMPDIALTYILQNVNKLFAREVVLALCRRIALYPTGTAVQLNTGERGIVARTQSHLPMRPLIQLQFDNKGRRYPKPVPIDLAHDSMRFVARSAQNLTLLDGDHAHRIVPQPILPAHHLG